MFEIKLALHKYFVRERIQYINFRKINSLKVSTKREGNDFTESGEHLYIYKVAKTLVPERGSKSLKGSKNQS